MNLGKFLVFSSIGVILALGYIHQQVELVKISYQINRQEQLTTQLVDQNKILGYNVKYLKSASHLENRLIARQVKLTMPHAQQVVQLVQVKPNPVYATIAKTKDAFIGLFALKTAVAAKPGE